MVDSLRRGIFSFEGGSEVRVVCLDGGLGIACSDGERFGRYRFGWVG